MRKITFIAIALFAFVITSCTNTSQKQTKEYNDSIATVEVPVADSHTSQISVDWQGVYEGVLPCADCEGIETTLELKDDETYVLTSTYLGKSDQNNTFTYEGDFTWSDDGSTITLENDDPTKRRFKVGENILFFLDQDGEVVTGELAEYYELKKKMD